MTIKQGLTQVRYYTAADPYYYTVDNRPITDLANREDALADELERRTYSVDITGAGTPIVNHVPQGWTVTRSGTGDYIITHNLASANYIVTGNVIGAPGALYLATAPAANSFEVKTVNMSGTATELRFNVLVTGY